MQEGPIRSVVAGRVLIVAADELSVARVNAVLRLISETARAVGRPLIYVPIVSPGAGVPSAETREALRRVNDALLVHCEQVIVVLPGTGAMSSLVRSALRALVLALGMRKRVSLASELRAGLLAAGDLGAPLATVLAAAEPLASSRS